MSLFMLHHIYNPLKLSETEVGELTAYEKYQANTFKLARRG